MIGSSLHNPRNAGKKVADATGLTSGAVKRMRLSACTRAAAKGRSRSSSRMLLSMESTARPPSRAASLRTTRPPRLCSSLAPPGPRNLRQDSSQPSSSAVTWQTLPIAVRYV